ncbi:mCG148010 [Mus musculus]|nr:mCG148010 [Mus musculus]
MTLSYESEARNLIGASMNVLEEILSIMPKITCKFYNTVADLVKAFKTLKGQIQTIRRARSISRRGAQARNLTSTGRSSGQGVSQMTRGARIRAGVFTSVFLGWDVYDLVNQATDLHDGGETESGGALRDLARKLEENLQKFEQKYNALQSDLPQ